MHDHDTARLLNHVVALCNNIIARLESIEGKVDKTMATQAELTKQFDAVNANLVKIGQETTKLLGLITDLQSQVANAPVSPELQAAADRVAAQAKVVDDLVPDAAPTP